MLSLNYFQSNMVFNDFPCFLETVVKLFAAFPIEKMVGLTSESRDGLF